MSTEGKCEKEQTIRELVKECTKAQGEIRAQLEKEFDRQPLEAMATPPCPSHPNVLDEIMDDLRELRDSQYRSIDFINHRINSKL